jgi:hypothetical protein
MSAEPAFQEQQLKRLFSRAVATHSTMGDGDKCIDIVFAVSQDCEDALKIMKSLYPKIQMWNKVQLPLDKREGGLDELFREHGCGATKYLENNIGMQISYKLDTEYGDMVHAFWNKYKDAFHRTFEMDWKAWSREPIPGKFPMEDGAFKDDATADAFWAWLNTDEATRVAPAHAAINRAQREQDTFLVALRQRIHQELS